MPTPDLRFWSCSPSTCFGGCFSSVFSGMSLLKIWGSGRVQLCCPPNRGPRRGAVLTRQYSLPSPATSPLPLMRRCWIPRSREVLGNGNFNPWNGPIRSRFLHLFLALSLGVHSSAEWRRDARQSLSQRRKKFTLTLQFISSPNLSIYFQFESDRRFSSPFFLGIERCIRWRVLIWY